jgi:hypothetical protein
MFEEMTIGNVFTAVIITGAVLFIILVYIAAKIESLSKNVEKQKDFANLKNQIVSDLKKGQPVN